MPRVALVTDWFAPRRGGIESQLAELAARLAAGGDEIGVVTATPGPPSEAPYAVRRLDVVTLPSPPLAVSPSLVAALRAELPRWDVVHAHVSVVSPTGWAAAWVARSLGMPCVVTFHSVLRGKAIALRALSAVAPVAESRIAWTAVSGSVATQARWALGGSVEVSVLPNGTDVAQWRSSTAGGNSAGRPMTLVTAMRLHRKKRGLALVRAFAHAMRGSSNAAALLVFGDGPERGAIEREVESLGLNRPGARVELRGWASADELRDAYASADAFVLASVHESFGIAALEAACAGLPVIARRSGVAEFVRHDHTGLLADSDPALAEALRRFADDPVLRARLRPDPAELARFDWATVVGAHAAQYERATRLAASPARAAGR